MKLSPAAELAVKGMVVLAREYGKGPTPILDVCSARDLPKEYLTKIFGLLTKGNLVSPIRGKHGGYKLARDPSQITLLDIIEAVEGPIVLNLCQHVPPRCQEDDCPFRPVWEDLQKTVRSKLGAIRLSQAASYIGKKPGLHPVITELKNLPVIPPAVSDDGTSDAITDQQNWPVIPPPGQIAPDHHQPGLNT